MGVFSEKEREMLAAAACASHDEGGGPFVTRPKKRKGRSRATQESNAGIAQRLGLDPAYPRHRIKGREAVFAPLEKRIATEIKAVKGKSGQWKHHDQATRQGAMHALMDVRSWVTGIMVRGKTSL